jgi:hypothetical protein
MEKERKGVKKTPVQRVSLAREAWVNIVLFLLAIVMIGSGVYFSFQPEWAKRADIKLYNQGVSTYLLPSEILPATDDRPEEYPIVRAAAYFQQAASESKDNRLKSLALYNLGTLMGGDALSSISGNTPWFGIADAITKLEQAVRTDPNNEDAKYNLELLEKLQEAVTQESGIPPEYLAAFMTRAESGYYIGTVRKGY